jgi:integrase
MGDILRRGTRDKPRFYIRYQDLDAGRKTRRVRVSTRDEARQLLALAEARVAQGRVGMEPIVALPKCGPLMDEWLETLANRNAADDRSRYKRHIRAAFADMLVRDAQEIGPVMTWMDRQRKAGKLSEASIRHNMNLLSRFFSWAVERGFAKVNPVRQIPVGKRPQQTQKRDMPWLGEDAKVLELIAALPEPVNLMFYLGNRSGLRTGEIAGLRMADLGYLKDRLVRVRYSYDGPLKEDKGSTGKMKWTPAPADASRMLGMWLRRRKLQGAKAEDLVFPAPSSPNSKRRGTWTGYRKEHIEDSWDEAAKECKVSLTWYQATRHSFVTRNLEAGASLDEVSEAVGHSSPVVTKRFYDHHVRKSFSDLLTRKLKA